MADVDPYAWAKQIAQTFILKGERLSFPRALRVHQRGLEALRAHGLTWQTLVQLPLCAGVQRPDGRPYSADQLRVCAARLQQEIAPVRTSTASARPAAVRRPNRRLVVRQPAPSAGVDPCSTRVAAAPALPTSSHAAAEAEGKDVSHDEIAAARARLLHIC